VIIDTQLMQKNPKTRIEKGAIIPTSCQIASGCEVSAQSYLMESVILEKNVRLVGPVFLHFRTVIRQNSVLVAPLEVMDETVISANSKVGLSMAEGNELVSPTRIGKQSRIGYNVEILGGIVLGDYCKIRAHSRVIGDVPAYGLVGGDPAVLENYICPICLELLSPLGIKGQVFDFGCPICGETKIRILRGSGSSRPGYVLLPNGKHGTPVSLTGYDPRWFDDLEMRWRG